jgi:hypothetical protein
MPTDITFYDNYEAALPAGSYRLVLQQTVNLQGEAARHYYRDQKFAVLAPRYAFDADEIQAYFPPSGGVADYRTTLPHLVLGTRNLPWERRPGNAGEPWLALLVLSEQDIQDGKAVFKLGNVADLVPRSASEWWRSEEAGPVLVPKFKREEDANTPVRLLDLNLDTFRKLCPSRKDLPFLAHIRKVDIANKVPLEMVADGEFSVLVANRFPPLGANTVYLISLEGWRELLDAPATTRQAASRVRLITLGNWSFVNDPNGHDTFGGLMQNLKNNSTVFGITLPVTSGEEYVDKALKRGYVPLDYKPVNSTPSFAWYRGPLTPLPRKPLSQEVFERADAAMIFDKSNGILDVSYASAWELGRLLALSSPAFVKGLRLFVEGRQNVAEFAREIEEFLKLHSSSFRDDISGDKKPEQVTITDELVQWIARLVLLYPVPFHYLVPHQSLLPSESLRFFYLDDSWVGALIDGAFSIAVGDVGTERQKLRTDLQDTLSKIVYQHRLRLQGQTPTWDPDESYMSIPKSGFLLRSRIVTGWPGVELMAKTNARSDSNLPQILRFDQISDGVLFCLTRGLIEDVTFREPREGLTFGVGSDGKLEARKTGKSVDVKNSMLRSGSPGVVEIAKLGEQLSSSGSAEFATQMIRHPEEQSIKWNLVT